jgi:hypothetical protein
MRNPLSSAVFLSLVVVPAVTAAAQVKPIDRQIVEAVSPLPETMRAGAKVLGYGSSGSLETIREGQTFVCLADDPANANFHVACYHESLEPFMARGPMNEVTGSPDSVAALFVIYMPNATEESTGVAAQPSRERPWLMFPGEPLSHIMISGGWRRP